MTTLENDRLKVSISEHGAELHSVFDKSTQQEDLWQADPAVWGRHAPVLFPFVGKVNGGEYRVKGRTWKMGQHGFARDMDFTKVAETADTCTYELKSTPETLEKYPFTFLLRISYKLGNNTIRIKWDVENPAEETMYFSIGGHPAFQAQTGYYVTFDGKQDLQYCLLDPETGCVDADHPRTLYLPDGYLKVTPELFNNDALIFDDRQIARATLCRKNKTPIVTIDCTGFPSFGLWCQKGQDVPFVCLEPWMGRADNAGFHGELSEKYEEQKLATGEIFTTEYSLTFE